MSILTSQEKKYIKGVLKEYGPDDKDTALYLVLRILVHETEEQANRSVKHPEELIEDLLEKGSL